MTQHSVLDTVFAQSEQSQEE